MSKYIYLHRPNHPGASRNGGNVLEHRIIMEKHIGRYLRPEEVVHHINGLTTDNRIENLRLFSSDSAHRSHHVASERARKAAEAIVPTPPIPGSHIATCSECGASYAKKRKHQTFCSPKCRKKSWEKERTVRPAYDIRVAIANIAADVAAIKEKIFGEEGKDAAQ